MLSQSVGVGEMWSWRSLFQCEEELVTEYIVTCKDASNHCRILSSFVGCQTFMEYILNSFKKYQSRSLRFYGTPLPLQQPKFDDKTQLILYIRKTWGMSWPRGGYITRLCGAKAPHQTSIFFYYK